MTQLDAVALVFAEDAADHDAEAGANVRAMGLINGDVAADDTGKPADDVL
ncbi:MAG: hypothetical protein OXI80_09130 [Caldilineaceae bacterium]|nr:hypothetical protein [Caldilineaceae bacterium]MDE0337820.1 hypothetical protein [Caldilineaceae bacterium]